MDFLNEIKQVKLNNKFSKTKGDVIEDINEAISVDTDEVAKDIYNIYKAEPFTLTKYLASTKLDLPLTGRVLAKQLVQDNKIVKYRSSYRLTSETISAIEGTDLTLNTKKQNSNTKLSTSKKRKLKVPKSVRGDRFDEFFREVYQNMQSTIKGTSPERLLLSGSPGSGKTSSINQLSLLFGLTLITIEGAHISEEDIINIPYVVTRGNNEELFNAEYKHNGADYEVINAESALVSKIKELSFIKEQEYQAMLDKNKLLKRMYLKYKDFIDSVRLTASHKSGFKCILFIDELLRTGDKKIQNLLRTILNGNIGNDSIPEGVYIITATNTDNEDGSLDDIALNQQFTNVNFDAPSKNDFANFIADKYTKYNPLTDDEDSTKEIRGTKEMQPEVYNAFIDNITDDDLSTESNGVRLSSRRMEQMMVYINTRVPVQNQEDARALMNFVNIQLTDYNEGTQSELLPKYKEIVKAIIAETSPGINLDDLSPLPDTNWNIVLSNEIDAKLEAAEDRSYPVMLSSLPGQGKTYSIKNIAKEKGMGLICIDASTLSIDSVNGLPVPRTRDDGSIETVFTDPPLYELIMKQYKAQYKDVYDADRVYNFILFIDEFSRVKSKQIQNKIRLLLLEKKVNSTTPIPDDIMIVGAMNPVDDAGSTTDLTQHTADVLDIIPVELSILDVEKHLKGLYVNYTDEEKYLGFKVQDIAFNLVQEMYTRFKSNKTPDGNNVANPLVQPYYWSIGDYLTIYVSPREITDMFLGIIQRIHDNFKMDQWAEITEFTPEVYDEFISSAKRYAYKKFEGSIDFIGLKQQIETVDLNKFKKIIKTSIDNSAFFDVIKEKKSEAVQMQSFSSLFKSVDYNLKTILENNGEVVIENWLNSLDDYTQASADIGLLFNDIKTIGFEKLFYFLNDFCKFLQKIDFSQIKGGTLDQLRMILIDQVHAIADDETFQISVMDLPEEDFDELIKNINALKNI